MWLSTEREGDMSYPAPPPASPPPASSGQSSTPSAGSFFNDLFDIRFTRFVSLRLISVVYILILVAVTLVALGVIFAGFAAGVGAGIFALILAALLWVVYVVLARVCLEAFAVLFRIHDDTNRMADALGGGRTAPAAGTVSNVDPGYGGPQTYPPSGYGTNQPPPPPTSPGTPPSGPSSPPWT
jgi:hypothetical protein